MKNSTLAAVAAIALGAASIASTASATVTVTFISGTYELADTEGAAPVDTLAVAVNGGVATFVLSGADTETFAIPDMSTPAGVVLGDSPYYASASLPSTSYSAAAYPYITLYTDSDNGGLTIGTQPADGGTNLVNLFESNTGSGQVFTISGVPEPTIWSMLFVGLFAIGYTMRRKARAEALAA